MALFWRERITTCFVSAPRVECLNQHLAFRMAQQTENGTNRQLASTGACAVYYRTISWRLSFALHCLKLASLTGDIWDIWTHMHIGIVNERMACWSPWSFVSNLDIGLVEKTVLVLVPVHVSPSMVHMSAVSEVKHGPAADILKLRVY